MARSVWQKNANPAKPFASVHENIEAQKPHTQSLKRRRIFPSPSAQRLTKPLMISLRSRAREVVQRRACASAPPVCSSVLSACVSRIPPAVLCPSACAREDSSGGVPAFSSSSSALNHVSSTTHFSSVSKRMKTFLEDEKGHPSAIPGYTTIQSTVVPSRYQSKRIS